MDRTEKVNAINELMQEANDRQLKIILAFLRGILQK